MKVPILLPNIFNHPFTYESDINLKEGDYVLVPFGKFKITGVVWDEFEKNNSRNFKIKSVLRKLNVTPLKKTTIKFLNWFSEYNIIPKGMALKLVLLSSNALLLSKTNFKAIPFGIILYSENQLRNLIVVFFNGVTFNFLKTLFILKFLLLFFSNSSQTTPVILNLPKGTNT